MTEEVKKKVDYWFEMAIDDLDVAKTMLQSKKYLYVGFFCHLLTEKALKGYFWFSVGQEPPYSHNLNYLSEKSGLVGLLSADQLELLDVLMPMQIAGRYPSDKLKLLKTLDHKKCSAMIENSERFLNWLIQLTK